MNFEVVSRSPFSMRYSQFIIWVMRAHNTNIWAEMASFVEICLFLRGCLCNYNAVVLGCLTIWPVCWPVPMLKSPLGEKFGRVTEWLMV